MIAADPDLFHEYVPPARGRLCSVCGRWKDSAVHSETLAPVDGERCPCGRLYDLLGECPAGCTLDQTIRPIRTARDRFGSRIR